MREHDKITNYSGVQYDSEYLINTRPLTILKPTSELVRTCDIDILHMYTDITSMAWNIEYDWGLISEYQPINLEFSRKYADKLVWEKVSLNQRVDAAVLIENSLKVNWSLVSSSIDITDISRVQSLVHFLDWDILIEAHDMYRIDFVRAFAEYVNWDILATKLFDEDVYIEFRNMFGIKYVSSNIPVDLTRAIYVLKDVINWNVFTKTHFLNEEFIDMFCRYIDFDVLVRTQKLPTSVLEKYSNIVNWGYIYKTYSPEVKRMFEHKFWWVKSK